MSDSGGRNSPGKGPEVGGLWGSRGPTPAPLTSGACSSGAERAAEPGSYLTPTPVPSAQEAARSHQQQTAHLLGKIPAEAETAVQGPPRAQDQVLHHVAQALGARRGLSRAPATGRPLPFAPSPPAHPPPTPLAGVFCLCSLPLSTQQVCVCVCMHTCACACTAVWSSLPFVLARVSVSLCTQALTVPLRLNPPNLPALCPWLSC